MPDPETTAGFDRINHSLEKLGDRIEASTGDIHSRINDLVSVVHDANTKIASIGSDLKGHIEHDDTRFKQVGRDIADAKRDRMGLWKIVAGGGIGAAVMKALTALGLSGRTPHG